MHLSNIMFPAFMLRGHEEIYTNPLGIRMVRTQFDTYVLDDVAENGGTLAQSRLRLKILGRTMYRLGHHVDTALELLVQPGGTTFIDSLGQLFTYTKGSEYYVLAYYKIDSLTLLGDDSTLVKLLGIDIPFIFGCIINTEMKYMGVLSSNGKYIPYSFSRTKRPSTRRKI